MQKVFLICKPYNKAAIIFYSKIGFSSLQSDETTEINGVNVFKDYDGPKDDKIIFSNQYNLFKIFVHIKGILKILLFSILFLSLDHFFYMLPNQYLIYK